MARYTRVTSTGEIVIVRRCSRRSRRRWAIAWEARVQLPSMSLWNASSGNAWRPFQGRYTFGTLTGAK